MNKPEYLEIEFAMPFYELFYPDLYNDNKLPKNPFELEELCELMGTSIDFDQLYCLYESYKDNEGEILIFHSNSTNERFIFIDLFKDMYDQMNMVKLGVRIKEQEKDLIRGVLEKLYFKSTTRSDWQEDYFNQTLWRTAKNMTNEYKLPVTQKMITEYKEFVRYKKHFRGGNEITESV